MGISKSLNSFQLVLPLLVTGTILSLVLGSQHAMARTLPTEALEQFDYYRPDKTLMISKKSATALNKLMVALRSIEKLSSKEKGNGADGMDAIRYNPGAESFNLQRRNQKDRKIYLRCYFNAVSCF